jgi:nicotinamidase-related amidase
LDRSLVVLNLVRGIRNAKEWTYCEEWHQTALNIIQKSKDHRHIFLVNDAHSSHDAEFEYIPPHFVRDKFNYDNTPDLNTVKEFKNPTFLTKETLSAVADRHNREVLLNTSSNVTVCGFFMSFDIIATVLGMIDAKMKVEIFPDGIGDVTMDKKNKGLELLKWVGVPAV